MRQVTSLVVYTSNSKGLADCTVNMFLPRTFCIGLARVVSHWHDLALSLAHAQLQRFAPSIVGTAYAKSTEC